MAVLHDTEFGDITIRRSKLSRHVRLSVAPNGRLRISMPPYAPLFLAKRLLASSRASVRTMLARETQASTPLADGMQIGKSHSLHVQSAQTSQVTRRDRRIVAMLAPGDTLKTPAIQSAIREHTIKALRKEAKSYLPKRLAYLAAQHEFTYQSIRFSHASSRWGSCSSSGTISLNIALMKLPFELIDYVLIHELCHTRQMNHSQRFWSSVEHCLPDYKKRRTQLKKENPMVL